MNTRIYLNDAGKIIAIANPIVFLYGCEDTEARIRIEEEKDPARAYVSKTDLENRMVIQIWSKEEECVWAFRIWREDLRGVIEDYRITTKIVLN